MGNEGCCNAVDWQLCSEKSSLNTDPGVKEKDTLPDDDCGCRTHSLRRGSRSAGTKENECRRFRCLRRDCRLTRRDDGSFGRSVARMELRVSEEGTDDRER